LGDAQVRTTNFWRTFDFIFRSTMNHHLSAETKHHILLEYSPHTYDHSFKALAIRHNIQGGRQVIEKWYAQWDRTPESLMEHKRSGRKRKLNTAQINELIAQPIIKAHSSATPIHYPKLMPSIRRSISEPISIQTIRRYGKKDLQFSNKTCIPRTKKESKYTHTIVECAMSLIHSCHDLQFLLLLLRE
jgi:hypothetical protein